MDGLKYPYKVVEKIYKIVYNSQIFRIFEDIDKGDRYVYLNDLRRNFGLSYKTDYMCKFHNAFGVYRSGFACGVPIKLAIAHTQYDFLSDESLYEKIENKPSDGAKKCGKKYDSDFWDNLVKENGYEIKVDFYVSPGHAADELNRRGYARTHYESGKPIFRKISNLPICRKQTAPKADWYQMRDALVKLPSVFLYRNFREELGEFYPDKKMALKLFDRLGVIKKNSMYVKTKEITIED